jgi:CBS domain-containing protein
MSNQAFKFLSTIPLFASLPENDRKKIADKVAVKRYLRGTTLSVQGRSTVDNLFLLKSGSLEIFYDKEGQKIQSGFLKTGDIFGGISILMNAGISVRTVKAYEDSALYILPKEVFLDLCTRSNSFYEYFVDVFSKRMLDESYASIVAANQAFQFLSRLEPFSFLPEEKIESLASQFSIVYYPKDTVLFVQGQSRIEYLFVIQKGAAERYYEENDKKILSGLLSEGDLYGGISMLLNNGIAVRTMRTQEDTYFYILAKKAFLDTCAHHDNFSEFFTDTFGKRMLDRSYAEIITKTMRPKYETLQFFNQSVENLYIEDPVSCPMDLSIQEAASVMSRHNCSSIFITQADGDFVGVVTDNDLRKKVIAAGYDLNRPVANIMSSPLSTISAQALVFEALMVMMQKNLKHLAVTDADDKVVGVITNRDLLMAQGQSPLFLIREISTAGSIEEIIDKHIQLPRLIQSQINSGAKSKNVTRLITTISDAILKKLIGFALDELGPAPVRFVFMILGSEGRKEQTLKTDQDNAIIFEDVSKQSEKEIQDYFLKFGETVCTWLDQAGYHFCKGGVMAKNPKWCQPLSVWKDYFSSWIFAAQPEDLLQASIFFDFRGGYGDMELIDQLSDYLFESLVGWAGFFRNLTENALHFKPPLGFFRNFVVESKGEHRDAFDIKSAMMPIVDFARIYALKNRISETNTQDRLNQLYVKKAITWEDYNELEQAYSFLMQLRFVRQVTAVIDENTQPDNYINPKKLSRIEQTMLKEIFKRIEKFQTKLSFDFTGIA